MATVDLTVAADLSALRKQLAEVPGLTADAAARMTSELNKSIKASERASKSAVAASKAAADQARATAQAAAEANARVADQVGAVGAASAKLRGSLSLLPGPLGEVAGLVNDLADAGEVAASSSAALVPALAAVAAVVGALSLAYQGYAREQEQAAAQAELTRQINADLLPTINAIRDAQLDLAVATGTLTEVQARQQGAANAASDAVRATAASQREQRKALQETIDGNEALIGVVQSLDLFGIGAASGMVTLADSVLGLSDKAADARQSLGKLDQQLVTEAENQKTLRKVTQETTAAVDHRTRAMQAATKADTAAADAARLVEEQERKILAQAVAYIQGVRELEGIARSANEARLEGSAAVEAQLARELERIDEIAARQAEAAINAGQQASIETARVEARLATEARYYEQLDEMRAKDLEASRAAEEQLLATRQQTAQASLSASAGLFGGISELAGAAADMQVGTSKDAAMQLFGIQKAAALAQAAVNTALSVSQALVTPPPIGPLQAAAALAAGLAQTAVIASTPPPSFSDTPGVMQMSSRGAVSLAAGDYFAAAKDPGELQRQTGATTGGSASILEVRLGHRVLDRSVAQTIRQGGRLQRELSRSTKAGPTGHAVRA